MDKRILAELEWISFETDTPLDQLIEDFNRSDTHLRDVGTDSSVAVFAHDTPGQSGYNKTNVIKRIAKEKGRQAIVNKRNYEPQLDNNYRHD